MAIKRIIQRLGEERLTSVIPYEIFRWPKGQTLTSVDHIVLALPKALFPPNAPMQEVVEADDEIGVAFPPESDNFLLDLQPGMSVTLRRNSETYVVADDPKPRRIRLRGP